MNAEEDTQQAIGDETSSINEDSPSASHNTSTRSPSNNQQAHGRQQQHLQSLQQTRTTNPDMKRSAVKELIERYFYQLQRGCGNPKCSNENCASSGQVASMNPNEIAARAIQLFSQDAKLCDFYSQPPKVPRTQNDSPSSSHSASSAATTPSIQDSDMLSPNDSSTSSTSSTTSTSSSSGNSTITSGSGSVNSPASQRSNISSGAGAGLSSGGGGSGGSGGGGGDANVVAASSSTTSLSSHSRVNSNRSMENNCAAAPADMCQLDILCNAAEAAEMAVDNSDLLAANTDMPVEGTMDANAPAVRSASGPPTPTFAPVPYLNEALLDELLDECKKFNTYDRLLHAINEVYPHVDRLSKSFQRPALRVLSTPLTSSATTSKLQELLGKSPNDLKKEDLRTLEGETDKDEDSTCVSTEEDTSSREQQAPQVCIDCDDEPMDEDGASDGFAFVAAAARGAGDNEVCVQSSSNDTLVDLESLRRVKKKLFALNNASIGEALNSNIILLAESIRYGREADWEKVLHCLVICFDMATNTSNSFADLEYLERSLPKLCHATRILPVSAQARLARIWAAHCKDQMQSLVQCCHQLITLQVILDEDTVQENTDVIAVTRVLKIAFYANILAGELDTTSINDHSQSANTIDADASSNTDTNNEDDDIFFYAQVPKPHYPKFAEDKLEKELGLSSMDCRVPLVPFEEFYNEPLSDAIQMDRDYLSYRNLSLNPSDLHFSFMLYSFILTPATKVIALYYDSRIRMYSERNSSLYSLLNSFSEGNESRPDLKLKVRRDNIIDDALIGLELVAMSNPKDLKKQLVVEFVGEQGIDEGGVSKEFFQLIVEEIFNPDYGMFVHQEDTNTVWFNSAPFENEAQFTLIGIILGLAIYNNIILAVNFPMVVYRKLMGGVGTFYDLKYWNPTLYRSLKSMLDYQEADMEEVFMQTFKISYNDVFGEVVEHELKSGGGDVVVGQHNKQEFVDMYSDYLLNKSIERQFRAFKKGFEMVTDESPLKLLFRPEEIELLVCGSRKFDFVELEKSTEYEGGYTKDSQVIKDFWDVVHSMPEESKRKLLEFTTGSDRVPVGGLSRLKLLITRHGPDSDRLPTSHTCFNVLLLPEYSNREKLEERLLKAINYSKGFGML
ncbi:ubiquitin-protein ligase E3A isoform X2 [Anastrepha ludens]|uniref:ubiquitin-protein ligase E3A isoform X2 n=1 Tax=Anastrepha ludens TaxID=28586 RepID=UPI0023B1FB9F|nr:ubiquitin-protein ligase E3A isoform X2 [Anastrepha ludens]